MGDIPTGAKVSGPVAWIAGALARVLLMSSRMRWQIIPSLVLVTTTACVGPGYHGRGGGHHSFGGGHHRGGAFGVVRGVAAITRLAANAATIAASTRPVRDTVIPSPPPMQVKVAGEPPWVSGALVAPANVTIPADLRLGLKIDDGAGRAYLSIIQCDVSGRFFLPLPTVGVYKLEVIDPKLRGESFFVSDGESNLLVTLPVGPAP